MSGKDPIGSFEMCFIASPLPAPLLPLLFSCYMPNDKAKVAVVEVKDLKQTIAIEAGYQDANSWLECIKYSVRTLNKSDCYTCAIGKRETQIVPFPLGWSSHKMA